MKKLYTLLLALFITFSLFGCTPSEEDKLVDLAVETICMAKEAMDEMMANMAAAMADPDAMAKMEAKGEEMEAKMKKMMQAAGYENEEELEKAFEEKIKDKDAWEAKITKAAKEKCGADEALMNEWFSEMDG